MKREGKNCFTKLCNNLEKKKQNPVQTWGGGICGEKERAERQKKSNYAEKKTSRALRKDK